VRGVTPGLALLALVFAAPARASFLSGEALDTAADWLALIVIVIVPIVAIVIFWLVHILPEIVAEKKQHPQKSTINTLCLLSLVFGGLLWPLAWILAYTKPVAYRLAYGTDKHDDYFRQKAEAARAGKLPRDEMVYLKRELDDIEEKRVLSVELMRARDEIAAALAAADATGSPA
jgi:CBS domain containing-hemolysin-like protein